MKKSFVTFLLVIIVSASSQAQSAAKCVYAEIGGPGVASVNFDSRFTKQESGLGGRIGVGGLVADGVGFLTIPAGLNYLLGKDNKNYFELGAGATFISASTIFDDNDNSSTSSVFGHLTIGYRLQPANGGFTFRAAINPVFGKGYFIPYWAGLSFGYKF